MTRPGSARGILAWLMKSTLMKLTLASIFRARPCKARSAHWKRTSGQAWRAKRRFDIVMVWVICLSLTSFAHARPPSSPPPSSPSPSPVKQNRRVSEPAYRSSLFELVEAVVQALESQAAREGVTGPVQLETSTGRGLDPRRADRVFTARLRRRLRERGRMLPVTGADLRARLVLSLEGSRLWAVGVLEGGALPGPSSFAVSRPMDRELETLFGKAGGQGQTRWILERLGPIPAGVLDVALFDIDDDEVDDIVVLSADGLRAFRYVPGAPRPEPVFAVRPLPGKRLWPRNVLGWIAPDRSGDLWLATSAGHRLLYDRKSEKFRVAPQNGVPLRQVLLGSSDQGPRMILARGWYGSPTLSAPFQRPDKRGATGPKELPPFVRDVVRTPGRDTWLWVDESGQVAAGGPDLKPTLLAGVDRAGDRIVLADLDGDGEAELVTSAARAPGEADQLSLYRFEPQLSRLTVSYRNHLSGGEIVALAVGDLDLDDRPDLLIIEEPGGEEAVVWRLEYAP